MKLSSAVESLSLRFPFTFRAREARAGMSVSALTRFRRGNAASAVSRDVHLRREFLELTSVPGFAADWSGGSSSIWSESVCQFAGFLGRNRLRPEEGGEARRATSSTSPLPPFPFERFPQPRQPRRPPQPRYSLYDPLLPLPEPVLHHAPTLGRRSIPPLVSCLAKLRRARLSLPFHLALDRSLSQARQLKPRSSAGPSFRNEPSDSSRRESIS